MSSQRVLIFGAGAIGRGFLGPLLTQHGIEISFVDVNQTLIEQLKDRNSYKVAITNNSDYEIVDVPISSSFLLGEKCDVENFDIVFLCVGPKNCYELADILKTAKTVISCENDMSTVVGLKDLTGNPNIYFGIPDVITSNTASAELLERDPLMTVTERGVLVTEKGNYSLPAGILQLENHEVEMHWMCKFFIHNAPHAIVAYLGWLKSYTYIHDAMADKQIEDVVIGAINEICEGIIKSKLVSKQMTLTYRDKEIRRFRNKLLYDLIFRVAREPLRKLSKDNRLILSTRICMFNGILPKYTATGIKAALHYGEEKDDEAIYLQNIRLSMSDNEILKEYSGIEILDPLNDYIAKIDISSFKKRENILC